MSRGNKTYNFRISQTLKHYIELNLLICWGGDCLFHLLNFFGIKVWQPLLCLHICGKSMLHCAEASIRWRYMNNLLQYFVILGHGTITTVFKRSFIQAFAAKLVLVWLRVITTVSFASQRNHFRAAEFFLEEARFSFIAFLMLPAASTRKKFCWIG